jgi:NACalpha-BTF3-like transcription factor
VPEPAQKPTPEKAEKPTPAKPDKPSESKAEPTKPDQKKAETKTASAAQSTTSKTTDKSKNAEKKETAKSSSSKASDFNADDISALLNKQEASGGGAKRSTEVASLGSQKKTGGSKLSQSEMDALKGIIEGNWNVIPGTESDGIQIKVIFRLDESGAIVGNPEVQVTGATGSSANVWKGSALRAIKKSAPFKNLPLDKYDAWSEVEVNFDPTELL